MTRIDFDEIGGALSRLREEELAYVSILKRAENDGSASAEVVQAHHAELARVRGALALKTRDALAAKDLLVQRINELRHQALEVRGNMEELRDHARIDAANATPLKQFSRELQRRYRDIFNRLSRSELELTWLLKALPEGAAPAAPVLINLLDAPSAIPEPMSGLGTALPPPARAGGARRKADERAVAAAGAAPVRAASAPGRAGAGGARRKDEPPVAAAASARAASAPGRAGERKLNRRYPYQAPVRLRSAERSLLGQSCDVSRGGLFVEVEPTLPAGTSIHLYLAIQGFPLEIEGRVVYETPGVGMGIHFTRIDVGDLSYLDRLLEELRAASAAEGTGRAGAARRKRPA